MYNSSIFWSFRVKNHIRTKNNTWKNKFYRKVFRQNYNPRYKRFMGKHVMDVYEANEEIIRRINNGEAFWVARYGHTEMGFVFASMRNTQKSTKADYYSALHDLCNNAGFFPEKEEYGEKYVDLIKESAAYIDIHGFWPLYMEDYMIFEYEKNVKLMRYTNMEPWGMYIFDGLKPWTHALKGKKVLVIHPFAETIESQYKTNRTRIFANKFKNADDILPEFELKTIKAVQTIAGTNDDRFENWFDALNWMIKECQNIDFDVAIVGCGAYGFPLAAAIKKMGKGVVQLCGSTQLLFGIMGKRWEGNEYATALVNDAWVRPSDREKVRGMSKVEDSCYW